MSGPFTAEQVTECAAYFEDEFRQHPFNTQTAAMLRAYAAALRAPQGPGWQPTLTEDQFQHAACVAMEYGSRAGYLALLDYMKLPPAPSSGSGEGR